MEEILLLLYANNFYNFANYLALVLLVALIWKNHGRLVIPRSASFGLLLLSSISYMLIYTRNYGSMSSSTFFLRFLAPIILYYIGYVIGNDGVMRLRNCILLIATGGFLHGFLNVLTNRNVDFLLISGRQYNDIYGGYLSGTLSNLYFVMICSLAYYFIVLEKNKIIKWLGVFSVLFGLYGSISNASRTLIFVTLIVFVTTILMHQYYKTNLLSAITNTGGIVLLLALVVLIVVWMDLFRVQEWFASTSLGRRSSVTLVGNTFAQNDRWTFAGETLKMLPSNLFGNMNYNHYAHNLWVDIAKEAGIIPFVSYILFAVSSILATVKAMRGDHYRNEEKLIIISSLMGIFMVFFTEPVMQGSPITFTLFCFIVGGYPLLCIQVSKVRRRKSLFQLFVWQRAILPCYCI